MLIVISSRVFSSRKSLRFSSARRRSLGVWTCLLQRLSLRARKCTRLISGSGRSWVRRTCCKWLDVRVDPASTRVVKVSWLPRIRKWSTTWVSWISNCQLSRRWLGICRINSMRKSCSAPLRTSKKQRIGLDTRISTFACCGVRKPMAFRRRISKATDCSWSVARISFTPQRLS